MLNNGWSSRWESTIATDHLCGLIKAQNYSISEYEAIDVLYIETPTYVM